MSISPINFASLGAGASGIGGIGPGFLSGVANGTGGTGGAGQTPGGQSFGDALNNAIGALENTQANATTAAEQLATGQATDPTTAITAVENASLSMQFASQIRNQIDTAATTIFQTQV